MQRPLRGMRSEGGTYHRMPPQVEPHDELRAAPASAATFEPRELREVPAVPVAVAPQVSVRGAGEVVGRG